MNRDQAKANYEKDLVAGYSPSDAKDRLMHTVKTGIQLPDPTEKYWTALTHQESGDNQEAVSPKGATGVAQVMPSTGPEAAALAGVAWDPVAFKTNAVYNARLGRAYFRKQMEDNGNDPAKALAAYNAGPGALRRAGGDISKLPAETQNYVPAIMNRADQGMQQDLDPPAEVAAAKDALMTPRDRARKAYTDALANGASPDEAKQSAMQFAKQAPATASQTAPTAPQAAPVAQQPAQHGATGSYEEPTFAQGLQSDIEKIYPTDPVTAGMGRSFAGMIQGARKLYNQATGDTAKVKELNADEQKSRDFWEKVDPKGSGFSQGDFGKLAGDASAFAGAPAVRGGTLAKTGYDTLLGGLQGLLQPTVADESQGVNAGAGALVGGTVSGAGSALRGAVGTPDVTRQMAGDALRARGVEIPAGQDYNSPIGSLLRRMGGENGSGPIPEQSLTAALAERMGMPGADVTNASLEDNLRRSGGAIGNLFNGATATPDQAFARRLIDIGRDYHMSGPVKNSDKVIAMLNHLLDMSKNGGRPVSGEEYQALRTGLSANSVTGSAAEKEAMAQTKRALDEMFSSQNPRPEAAGLRSEYRLSKILRSGSGIPSEGMTSRQMRNRIEGAAGKGEVNSDVRGLLSNTNQVIPTARIGGDAAAGAGDSATIRGLDRPGLVSALMALTRAGAGPLSRGYDNGLVQALVNDPTTRVSLANLLRGGVIPPATPKGEQ